MEFSFGPAFDKVEMIPEQFRTLYEEKDGKHQLKSEDATVKGAVAAIVGLNSALQKERKSKVDLSALKDYGSTVEEIAAGFRSKVEDLTAQIAGGDKLKAQVEKIRAELAAGHAKDVEALKARSGALTAQLHGLLVTSAAKSAIAGEKGDIELLLPFVEKRLKATEADGAYAVQVIADDGETPRYSGVTGQPMTIAELVKEMKANAKYGKLFESEAPKGAGPKPGVTANKQLPQSKDDMSPTHKIRAGFAKRQAAGVR